jgi:4-hydroxybenzoate polyprenyltransferase
MVTTRTAAMAFNRYIDRKIDALNPRTAIREIPIGVISPNGALLLTIISSFLFIITTFFINRICFYLSPIALFITLGYSYTKRFTWLCHFILGSGLALAPVGAYMAITASISLVPILLAIMVLLWVSSFDLMYALQDESFDKKNQLHSVPVWLGSTKTLIVSAILHLIVIVLVFSIGYLLQAGIFYYICAIIFSALLVYQHAIVKPNDISKINLAFFTLNGLASIIFACFFLINYFTQKL